MFRRSCLSFPIHLSLEIFFQNGQDCLHKWLHKGIQGSQPESWKSHTFCLLQKNKSITWGWLLVIFQGVSGLPVNRRKNHLFPVNMVPIAMSLARALGYQVSWLPTICLGLALWTRGSADRISQGVSAKCEKTLASWIIIFGGQNGEFRS